MMVTNNKIEFDASFWAGVGCGICVGASLFVLKKKGRKVTFKLIPASGFKLVFVVRTDLNMTKGKIAAQCSHAAVGAYKASQTTQPKILEDWESSGQPKIALRTDSINEIMRIMENANKIGLLTTLIRDDGRTQIPHGSVTVLGVGPAPTELVNKVTGHLKLL